MHEYSTCALAQANGCGYVAYQQWRLGVDFGDGKHCWECGLSQSICRRLERPVQRVQCIGQQEGRDRWVECEYLDIMLPSIFILHQQQNLHKVVVVVGFQGMYNSLDLWEWLNSTCKGFGEVWESNWMATWAWICKIYIEAGQAEGKAWAMYIGR